MTVATAKLNASHQRLDEIREHEFLSLSNRNKKQKQKYINHAVFCLKK